jgi:two pore calcium channel protein 1/two pore calcium channel protein 3
MSIYLLEAFLKLSSYGIEAYFDENWNKFDFLLVMTTVLFDVILAQIFNGNVGSSLQASKVLKITKIQKVFRLFRAFRTIKILSFFAAGLEIF